MIKILVVFKEKKNPLERGSSLETHFLHKNTNKVIEIKDLKDSVKKPADMDKRDWVAENLVQFYNDTVLLFGSLNDECTEKNCPLMTAGPEIEYFWTQGEEKPLRVSAPVYAHNLFEWIGSIINDENVFPTDPDIPFPDDYDKIVSRVFTRLLRLFAHIYYAHFTYCQKYETEAYLNGLFKHFNLFVVSYKLVDDKEFVPLKDLIKKLDKM